jgi:hypothetical protein
MATTRDSSGGTAESGQAPKAAKLADDFKPNEPVGGGTGIDAEGKPDQSLSEKQVERGASEALLSLRPQPSAEEITRVLEALAEKDEKGQPKNKLKTAKEAGAKAVEELNKQRGG